MQTMLHQNDAADRIISQLSDREYDLVWGIALGLTAEEMCAKFKITYGTLRRHKFRIKKKMQNLPIYGWPLLLVRARGTECPKHLI